ncbi:toxin [Mycetocola tolaasinivorans]|uniref:Toxin n=1 Tax=Mycetocola tolaasinivorans TaxID=76635 RepID=A0A3L7A203_9MICO|nr:toxin [Mycetocola tolaasinivorans]
MHVQVHRSALKRGLSVDEVTRMWMFGTDEMTIYDGVPPRYVRLAFDSSGLPWEVASLAFGSGSRYLIIHAMPARKSTVTKMQGRLR